MATIKLPITTQPAILARHILNKKYLPTFQEMLDRGSLGLLLDKIFWIKCIYEEADTNEIKEATCSFDLMGDVTSTYKNLSGGYISIIMENDYLVSSPNRYHLLDPIAKRFHQFISSITDELNPQFLEMIKLNKKNLLPIKDMLATFKKKGDHIYLGQISPNILSNVFVSEKLKNSCFEKSLFGKINFISGNHEILFDESIKPQTTTILDEYTVLQIFKLHSPATIHDLINTIDILLSGDAETIVSRIDVRYIKMLTELILAKNINSFIISTGVNTYENQDFINQKRELHKKIFPIIKKEITKINKTRDACPIDTPFGACFDIKNPNTPKENNLTVKMAATLKPKTKTVHLKNVSFFDNHQFGSLLTALSKDINLSQDKINVLSQILEKIRVQFKINYNVNNYHAHYLDDLIRNASEIMVYKNLLNNKTFLELLSNKTQKHLKIGEVSEEGINESVSIAKLEAIENIEILKNILKKTHDIYITIQDKLASDENIIDFIEKNNLRKVIFNSSPNQKPYEDKKRFIYDISTNELQVSDFLEKALPNGKEFVINKEVLNETQCIIEKITSENKNSILKSYPVKHNRLLLQTLIDFFMDGDVPRGQWEAELLSYQKNIKKVGSFFSIQEDAVDFLANNFPEETLEFQALGNLQESRRII